MLPFAGLKRLTGLAIDLVNIGGEVNGRAAADVAAHGE